MGSQDRTASVKRITSETNIMLEIALDGNGTYDIQTGIGFFDHMLAQLSKHSGIDIKLTCEGDLFIDSHHTVEDVGIAFGQALKQALGDKKGIARYADTITPMDETLTMVVLDLSGRCFSKYTVPLTAHVLGTLETEAVSEFFSGFARACEATLHIKTLEAGNAHHTLEGVFKGFARTIKEAIRIVDTSDTARIPSTKGSL